MDPSPHLSKTFKYNLGCHGWCLQIISLNIVDCDIDILYIYIYTVSVLKRPDDASPLTSMVEVLVEAW